MKKNKNKNRNEVEFQIFAGFPKSKEQQNTQNDQNPTKIDNNDEGGGKPSPRFNNEPIVHVKKKK